MRAAREFAKATLTEHLPSTWRVVSTEVGLDHLDRLTVRVSNQAVKRAEAAPMGAYDSTLLLVLISPNSDLSQAETELEDALEVLIEVIEDHFGTAWDEASKVLYADDRMAWQIPLHVLTSRTETN